MRRTSAIFFSLLLAMPLAVAAQPASGATDTAAVSKVLGDYKAPLERLDMTGVDKLFAEENVVIENGKLKGSYADYLTNHIGPELGHFTSFSFSDYKPAVRVHGDAAWATETYRYKIVLKDDGNAIERQGVSTSVLHRTDAGWRIVSMHGSSRAPKPASP